MPTPNVAQLAGEVDNPVNLFTGQIGINVPIYNLKVGDFEMPISINYDGSGIKPDVHPGIVGMNWFLKSGGAITRKVHDIPDDYNNPNKTISYFMGTSNTYWGNNYNSLKGGNAGYYFNHSAIKNISPSKLNELMTSGKHARDTEPDEFIFNFCGIQGKFFLDENGNWQVQSDRSLKVSLNGFMELPEDISGKNIPLVWEALEKYESSTFKGFTIYDEYGNRYIFGSDGSEEDDSALEYSVPFHKQHSQEWLASSWKLKKIITTNNQIIDFDYSIGKYICDIGISLRVEIPNSASQCYSYESHPWYTSSMSWISDDRFGQYQTAFHYGPAKKTFDASIHYQETTNDFIYPKFCSWDGTLIRPTYLEKITTTNTEIIFSKSNSTQLRYKDNIFLRSIISKENGEILTRNIAEAYRQLALYVFSEGGFLDTIKTSFFGDNSWTNKIEFYNEGIKNAMKNAYGVENMWAYLKKQANSSDEKTMLNSMQWKKLDRIIVQEKGKPKKSIQFDFLYNDNANERLMLKQVQKNTTNESEPPYIFTYHSGELPNYCEEKTDHWGFFNNYPTNSITRYRTKKWHDDILDFILNDTYYERREPTTDVKVAQRGMLKNIKYPTGGSSEFIYELNKYSKFIDNTNPQKLNETTEKVAGGLRISEVRKYDENLTLQDMKSYFYVHNYTNKSNLIDLTSSGTLSNIPKYVTHVGYKGLEALEDKTIFSSQSINPLSTNCSGTHIGYSEVIVQNIDKSYSIFKYSNYKDYNEATHYDEIADMSFLGQLSAYIPITSNSMERGKILLSTDYNSSNTRVKEVEFKYKRYNESGINALLYNVFKAQCPQQNIDNLRGYYAIPYRYNLYNYNLHSKVTSFYGIDGNFLVDTHSSYDYTINNRIKSHIEQTSNGDEIETLYSYPNDFKCSITSIYYDPISQKEHVRTNKNIYQEMVDKNMVALPVEKIIEKNDKTIGAEISNYSNFSGSIKKGSVETLCIYEPVDNYIDYSINPSLNNFVETKDSRFKESISYDLYDDYGNILQYRDNKELITSYIWGYNQQYPIAKVENATYIEVKNLLNSKELGEEGDTYWTALKDGYFYPADGVYEPMRDTNYRSFLGILRNTLPNSQVTIYTYKPLFGMTSQTDSNGFTTYYEYDDFGRLELVKDHDGNIIKKNTYNYIQPTE